MDSSKIKPGQMVHLNLDGRLSEMEGEHVGTVDHLDGDYIKLMKTDSPDQKHRWVPLTWVNRVDSNTVFLNCTRKDFENLVVRTEPVSVKKSA